MKDEVLKSAFILPSGNAKRYATLRERVQYFSLLDASFRSEMKALK